MNGYARMERFSFEAYNEADDFFHIVERYRSRYGRYPAHIRTDHIYRNRKILAFCKEHGIRLTGPALGRPPKDKTLSWEQKRQEYTDICDRNTVEGAFGTLKTPYGLGRIAARLEDTSRCVIWIALLLFNLTKRLRDFLRLCFCCWMSLHFPEILIGCIFEPVAEYALYSQTPRGKTSKRTD